MKTRWSTPKLALAAAVIIGWGGPLPLMAQGFTGPTTNSLIVGSAGMMYMAPSDGLRRGTTSFEFMPTFLMSVRPNLLFESEVHFTPTADGVDTEIEYAQVEYQGFSNLQLVAGQFLLPFGVFGPDLHMGWINKLPDLPLLYTDDVTPDGTLMALPFDFGVQANYARSLSDKLDLNASLYATQGPQVADGTPAGGTNGPPALALGTGLSDNNNSKLVGARVGLVAAPNLEVYASGFLSKYDPAASFAYDAANLAAIWRPLGAQVLGEVARTWQGYADAAQAHRTLGQSAYFLQLSRRFGALEPVVRWGQLLDGTADGETLLEGKHQVAIGADYWIGVATPVKVAYEFNSQGKDQLLLQWVFGF